MGVGPELPPTGGPGRGSEQVRGRAAASLRPFLSQGGMIPGNSSHGKQQKRHPRETRGGTKGVPGRVSCWVGDLRGCSPGARPGLGFASSLAQAQATLGPILQACPGFLSHWPHPAQEGGRAPWRPPQKHRSFLGQEWAGCPSLLSDIWPLTSRPPALCLPARSLNRKAPLGFTPRSS